MRRTHRIAAGAVAAVVAFAGAGLAEAAVVIDGSMSPGEGYTLDSVQVNPTSSPSDSSGGPQPPSTEVNANSTGNFTQLSNAYSYIDSSTNTLNLFIGGSMYAADAGVSHYIIALQTNNNGVANLQSTAVIHGSAYNVNNPSATTIAPPNSDGLNSVSFDTGFKPNALFIVQPNTPSSGNVATGQAAYSGFTDLSGGGATDTPTVAYNNLLQTTPIGTGAAGDPGFAGASTGLEMAIPLGPLGYTPGTTILASIFTSNGGSDGRTNNQVLAPFVYNPNDPSGGYDYTYFDSTENNGATAGRQFTGVDYPGLQYFSITAGVPEPTSLGALGLTVVSLLGGRVRRRA